MKTKGKMQYLRDKFSVFLVNPMTMGIYRDFENFEKFGHYYIDLYHDMVIDPCTEGFSNS